MTKIKAMQKQLTQLKWRLQSVDLIIGVYKN